jgi:hypothetical protein
MAGFANDIVYANNGDFSIAGSTKGQAANGLLTNGQFWIGSTALNVGGTHINVGTITSPLGTLTVGYSSPNITIDLAGGGLAIDSIAVQTGTSPIVPTAGGLVTINGATVAAGTNPVRTDGTGVNTMAVEVQISQAIASTNATNIGLAAFNSAQFTVDANGFVSSLGDGFVWIDQATGITLAINRGYFVTTSTTQTLPAAPSQGDVVKIICDTTGAVVVTANTGQTIRLGNTVSATAGNAMSTQRGDALELIYRAATTQWIALNSTGNWVVT